MVTYNTGSHSLVKPFKVDEVLSFLILYCSWPLYVPGYMLKVKKMARMMRNKDRLSLPPSPCDYCQLILHFGIRELENIHTCVTDDPVNKSEKVKVPFLKQ